MLRHKVLQQALRLAFGISVPEFTYQEEIPAKSNTKTKMTKSQVGQPPSMNRRAMLKEKLREISSE